ncbi:MAG: enoyl-CoA hydratase/isomerase family protein [Burkholderiales bacterium]
MSDLQIEREGPLNRVTLDRPHKANALGPDLVEALLRVVEKAGADGTRLMSLRANGRNFSAGFDFTDFEDCTRAELLWRFVRIEQLLQAVYHAPFATAAFAHGKNFGAGADLFMACDTRIATADATFRMPGLLFGIQLGTRRLAARIGPGNARSMLAETRSVSGTECAGMAFATRLTPQGNWADEERRLVDAACMLDADAGRRLRCATVPDTRAVDLADLVTSATHGDLKERIRQYRQSR